MHGADFVDIAESFHLAESTQIQTKTLRSLHTMNRTVNEPLY